MKYFSKENRRNKLLKKVRKMCSRLDEDFFILIGDKFELRNHNHNESVDNLTQYMLKMYAERTGKKK